MDGWDSEEENPTSTAAGGTAATDGTASTADVKAD
tara:strand:- start:16 stop:120 length:105 start_codon:yes stop_codon:yes gene_type:complete